MRTGKKGSWTQLWKRNAVVAAIALFICAAVYLNWSYGQETEAGKTLGQSTLVGGQTSDPLVTGDSSAQTGAVDQESSAAQPTAGEADSEYFATARLNRQQARDSALSLLQDAAAGEGVGQEAVDQANLTIQTMAEDTVTEAQIENLVMAKGYADCVAFIGEDGINVVVSAPEAGLAESDTAKIMDIVLSETPFTVQQVKIIGAEG